MSARAVDVAEVGVARGNVPFDQDVLVECERLYVDSEVMPLTRDRLESIFG